MIPLFEINAVVTVFDKYEGIVVSQHNNMLTVYCPSFNPAEPYLVVDVQEVVLSDTQERTGFIS